jgi:hypothetical protein
VEFRLHSLAFLCRLDEVRIVIAMTELCRNWPYNLLGLEADMLDPFALEEFES